MRSKDKTPQTFKPGDRLLLGEVITVYGSVANEDGMEGRGQDIVFSYHLTEKAALIGTSGIGGMAPDGKVQPFLALRFTDGRYALVPELITIVENPQLEADLREKALSKLTPAERAALLGSK